MPAKIDTVCSSNGMGLNCGCFSSSVSRAPRASRRWVEASRSEPNCAKAAISRYCASSSLIEPDTFFIALVCAAEPTRDTDRPTLIAGRMPAKNRSVSRKIWPSVIEMTLVGMYADTSPACVSMIGNAVSDPPPFASDILAARSSRREWR